MLPALFSVIVCFSDNKSHVPFTYWRLLLTSESGITSAKRRLFHFYQHIQFGNQAVHNKFVNIFLFLIPFLYIPVISGATTTDYSDNQITFQTAWEMVNARNNALKAAQENVEEAKFKQKGARDLFLPDISVTANYLYLDEDVKLSPDDIYANTPDEEQARLIGSLIAGTYGLSGEQFSAGLTTTIAEQENFISTLTMTWPVFTGGRILAAQRIAEGNVQEANSILEKETLEQFQNLVKLYFGTALTRTIFHTRHEVETGLKKHRDHAMLLEEQGQIAKVERMQAEAAYDKAIVERKKAYRDFEIAQVALTKLLQSETSVSPADYLFVENNLPALETFTTATLNNYPGLKVLESKQEQAKGLVAVERGKYFPTVALVGNYTIYEEENLATQLAPDWMVGVGVTMPLIDRSGRSGKYQAAKSTVRRIENLKNQAKSDLQVLVEKSYRQTRQALEEYEGLHSSQALANETVSLRIKAFSQGLGTSLDVVDAELFLAQVKTQRAVAVYNYIQALSTLTAISSNPESFFQYQNNNGIEE